MLWNARISPNSLNLSVKVDKGQVNFDPTRDWRTLCGDHFTAHAAISTMSNHSLYLWQKVGRVEMLWYSWINPNIHHLGVKWRVLELILSPPRTQNSRSVVMVGDDELKSQPCKTIQYTYNETLKGLGCFELPESVQTHSILVWKVEYRPSQLLPQFRPETHHASHNRAHKSISTISNHSLYLWREIGRVELVWNV